MDTSCNAMVTKLLGREQTPLSTVPPEDLLATLEELLRGDDAHKITPLFTSIAEAMADNRLAHSGCKFEMSKGFTKFVKGQGLGLPTTVAAFPWTERHVTKCRRHEKKTKSESGRKRSEAYYVHKRNLLLKKDGPDILWAHWELCYKKWVDFEGDRWITLRSSNIYRVDRRHVVKALNRNPELIGPVLWKIEQAAAKFVTELFQQARRAEVFTEEASQILRRLGGGYEGRF